jgi:hypothetical protein
MIIIRELGKPGNIRINLQQISLIPGLILAVSVPLGLYIPEWIRGKVKNRMKLGKKNSDKNFQTGPVRTGRRLQRSVV